MNENDESKNKYLPAGIIYICCNPLFRRQVIVFYEKYRYVTKEHCSWF